MKSKKNIWQSFIEVHSTVIYKYQVKTIISLYSKSNFYQFIYRAYKQD